MLVEFQYPHTWFYLNERKPTILTSSSSIDIGYYYAPIVLMHHGSTILNRFDNVQYVTLVCKDFGTIEIDIRDDTGTLVPYERGKVTATLHFRRRRTELF